MEEELDTILARLLEGMSLQPTTYIPASAAQQEGKELSQARRYTIHSL